MLKLPSLRGNQKRSKQVHLCEVCNNETDRVYVATEIIRWHGLEQASRQGFWELDNLYPVSFPRRRGKSHPGQGQNPERAKLGIPYPVSDAVDNRIWHPELTRLGTAIGGCHINH